MFVRQKEKNRLLHIQIDVHILYSHCFTAYHFSLLSKMLKPKYDNGIYLGKSFCNKKKMWDYFKSYLHLSTWVLRPNKPRDSMKGKNGTQRNAKWRRRERGELEQTSVFCVPILGVGKWKIMKIIYRRNRHSIFIFFLDFYKTKWMKMLNADANSSEKCKCS